jgi:RimJ/RimL family protein N-acetyltransferase
MDRTPAGCPSAARWYPTTRAREEDVAEHTPGPETGDLLLRDVAETDLPILFEHQRDPEATRMAAFPSRDRDAFMAHWRDKVLGGSAGVKKAIVFDGQVVGNIVSFERDGVREVGYWIGREHWGKGIATRALTRFLLLERYRPLTAVVAVHNVASRRVLEKCGFRVVHQDGASPTVGDDGVEEVVLRLEA